MTGAQEHVHTNSIVSARVLDGSPTAGSDSPLARVLCAVSLDPSRKFGSLEEQFLLLAKAFQARASVFVPLFSAGYHAETARFYREAGLEAAFIDLNKYNLASLEQLLTLIRRLRIDVVHWHFFTAILNPYLWLVSALAPRVQHFFTDHNSRTGGASSTKSRATNWIKRLLLKRYARVIGVSEFNVRSMRLEGAWPNPVPLTHFVNVDRFVPDAEVRATLRQKFGVVDHFVLATVAYLIPDKGIDVALRAMCHLPDSVQLWVVGDGPEAGSLQALAQELGVQGRVRFFGRQEFVQPFMQAADAFVCPSRWAEAAGLVNLEAQSAGLPVLASDTGGIPEYVADGRSGFLFPVDDHVQLAGHVRRLADDRELCRAMGRAARAFACSRFSLEARLEDYLTLYAASKKRGPK